MRHKLKKEALDTIVQKMINDATGDYLGDLLKVAEVAQRTKNMNGKSDLSNTECQAVLKNIDWLYGYESEVQEALETLRIKLEAKIFNKDSSHVTIVSCIVCYCTLSSILNHNFDEVSTTWDEQFSQCESKKVSESLEILKRHCPEKIDVQGFFEARRYIRIWDSEYNW